MYQGRSCRLDSQSEAVFNFFQFHTTALRQGLLLSLYVCLQSEMHVIAKTRGPQADVIQ